MIAEASADALPLTPFSSSSMLHFGGYCSPFDLSALFLTAGMALITLTWSENYGSGAEASSGCNDLAAPLTQMKLDPAILMIGGVISLFEGSMYIFVFNWTPALSGAAKTTPPFGASRAHRRDVLTPPHCDMALRCRHSLRQAHADFAACPCAHQA
jgi:hypothetical protein